jgi:hypothetical protein
VATNNDEAASRLSILVDGVGAVAYRHGQNLCFPRFYPVWNNTVRPDIC